MAPPLTGAQARLLDVLLEQVRGWVSSTGEVSRVFKARVAAVTVAGATDGRNLALLEFSGLSDIPAPYLDGYAPTVDHTVAVVRTGSQLLILGRIVGTPPA